MWMNEVISLLRYKPGATFSYKAKESGVIVLTFSMEVTDVHDPSRKTTLVIHEHIHEVEFLRLSQHDREWKVVDLFATMVSRFEQHEVHEWLKFNGDNVIEPHPRG